MNVEYRRLREDEIPQARRLWEYCFREDKAFDDWFFSERFNANTTLAAFKANELLATTQLLPYTLNVRGREVKAAYVVGVATWPNLRGMGLATELLKRAINESCAQGVALLPLYPFSYAFYEKQGFTTCYEIMSYDVPLAQLQFRMPKETSVRFTDLAAISDRALLNKAYEISMAGSSGFSARDDAFWLRRNGQLNAEGGTAAVVIRGGEPIGGLLYGFEGDALRVDEFLYSDADSLHALFSFIGGHHSTCERAKWALPAHKTAWRNLPDARGLVHIEPHAMLRIASLDAAMKALPVPADAPDVTLCVTDEICAENNSIWRFTQAGISRINSDENLTPDAEVSITELTRWYVGFDEPGENQPAALRKWFPARPTSLTEQW